MYCMRCGELLTPQDNGRFWCAKCDRFYLPEEHELLKPYQHTAPVEDATTDLAVLDDDEFEHILALERTLQPLHRKFLNEYLRHFNRSKAARSVGFDIGTGYRVLNRPDVRKIVSFYLERDLLSARETMRELGDIAQNATLEEAFDSNGDFDFRLARDNGVARFIQRVRFDGKTGQVIEVAMLDRTKALAVMAKAHGLYDHRKEADWRGELKKAGIDEKNVLTALVQFLVNKQLERNAGEAGTGSARVVVGEGNSQPVERSGGTVAATDGGDRGRRVERLPALRSSEEYPTMPTRRDSDLGSGGDRQKSGLPEKSSQSDGELSGGESAGSAPDQDIPF